MPRTLRTPIAPGKLVKHECRDDKGKRIEGAAASNTLCRKCNTQLVYVRNADQR